MSDKRILYVVVSGFFAISLACSISPGSGGKSATESTSNRSGTSTERANNGDGGFSNPTEKPGSEFSSPTPNSGSGEEQPTEESTVSGPTSAKVGDVFRNGYLRLVVLGWQDVKPTDRVKPEPGNKIIRVDVAAVNLWNGLLECRDSFFTIKDSDAREYTQTVDLASGSSGYTNDYIFPGERMTASFGFQVPQESSGFILVMKEDSYNHLNRVLIDLGSQSGIQEPPATIEGEVPPEIQAADSTASCGKWNIHINAAKIPTVASEYTSMLGSGLKILLTDLTLENTDSSDKSLSVSDMFWLQESSGQRYGQSFIAESISRGQVQGSFFSYGTTATSGEKIRGWIGFDVPASVAAPYLVFWCGVSDSRESVEKVDIALPSA
jgi:hypothetical protein